MSVRESAGKAMSIVVERYLMDRRRVEAAHFQFAILQVASWYPHVFDLCKLPLHSAVDDTLNSVVSIYHGTFMAQNAGEKVIFIPHAP